jgi:multicomponent Na+:H+ antiporter subunit D
MLAYSSISQVGYIILGIGLGTPLGILGALFHLFNHALAKSLLFLNSGSIQMSTGTRNLDEMGGLAKRMPWTAGTSIVGSLSIAGVPPLNGFSVIAVLASVLTLWYYLLIQRRAFFGCLNDRWREVREAPFWMTLSTVILSLICIAVGIFFSLTIKSWIAPARDALTAGVRTLLGAGGM